MKPKKIGKFEFPIGRMIMSSSLSSSQRDDNKKLFFVVPELTAQQRKELLDLHPTMDIMVSPTNGGIVIAVSEVILRTLAIHSGLSDANGEINLMDFVNLIDKLDGNSVAFEVELVKLGDTIDDEAGNPIEDAIGEVVVAAGNRLYNGNNPPADGMYARVSGVSIETGEDFDTEVLTITRHRLINANTAIAQPIVRTKKSVNRNARMLALENLEKQPIQDAPEIVVPSEAIKE